MIRVILILIFIGSITKNNLTPQNPNFIIYYSEIRGWTCENEGLNILYEKIKNHNGVIKLTFHTEDRGSERNNLTITKNQSEEVSICLKEKYGLECLLTEALGESKPLILMDQITLPSNLVLKKGTIINKDLVDTMTDFYDKEFIRSLMNRIEVFLL